MSQISEYLQRSASQDTQSKGRNILHLPNAVARVILDETNQTAFYRVQGEHSRQWFEVTVKQFSDGPLRLKCSCPDSYREMCKHAVAALMHLDRSVNGEMNGMTAAPTSQLITSGETRIPMRWIDMTLVHQYMMRRDIPYLDALVTGNAVRVTRATAFDVEAEVQTKAGHQKVTFQRNKTEGVFETSCGCNHRETAICVHKGSVFYFLAHTNGPFYFTSLEDHSSEKRRLLSHYGFTIEDDLEGKFAFEYDANGVILRLLDASLMPVSAHQTSADRVISPALRNINAMQIHLLHSEETGAIGEPDFGLAFRLTPKLVPGFSVELFSGRFEERRPVGSLKTYDAFRNVFTDLHLRPNVPLQAVAQLFSAEALQQLRISQNMRQGEDLITPYLQDRLPRAWTMLQGQQRVFLTDDDGISPKSLELLNVSSHLATLVLELLHEAPMLTLRPRFEVDGALLPADEATFLTPFFVLYNGTLYLLRHIEQAAHWAVFAQRGALRVHDSDRHHFIREVVLPFRSLLHVLMPAGYDFPTEQGEPAISVYLTEREPYLVIKPIFSYGGHQLGYDGATELLDLRQAQPKFIRRDIDTEREFVASLKASHPLFAEQSQSDLVYLPFNEVMRNAWFLNFHTSMRNQNVEILGFKELSRFRYNPNKPSVQFSVGSGVDWFEIDAEITFGDQTVRLADVRKAVLEKRDYVELADGTLGLLPQEWLKRYGLLLKMSEKHGNGLRVSKFHYSLIDELSEQISDNELQMELLRKRRKLQDFSHIEDVELPLGIKADLRPYQKDGYKWLRFLQEFGWGGILADDMGLGKTVQTLVMLQWVMEQDPTRQCLIVCPKSLIYNWEKEIQKFTPLLTYAVYHGTQRKKDMTDFYDAQLILTSYGTVRTDIEMFNGIQFAYVVLDESQAIKNPSAQASKAVHLLRTNNRLCLSGTPLQNNTYDLYAQLNFLNPGMMGSMEFFREQFVAPIDRQNDKEATAQLRKVVAPFILRRVKEDVAKDLPPKTETVVYCTMEVAQRRVYDAYRNEIRLRILKQIDEQGISRSGLLILQGLTRLRQICDSPSIVKEGGEDYPEVSVKADELIREISENAGGHKTLVFSQFLGMLDLLRRRLESLGIRYEYFDGASSTKQRQISIDRFQTDPDVRVFLISLKAGGVGLNLTAADYVYIVDPWWNPAVEQQAIDRTHRIGQDKAIFAYKMICRDTVEEKILLLQDRKRVLAAELVSDDAAFIQKLTRDDIVFLFS